MAYTKHSFIFRNRETPINVGCVLPVMLFSIDFGDHLTKEWKLQETKSMVMAGALLGIVGYHSAGSCTEWMKILKVDSARRHYRAHCKNEKEVGRPWADETRIGEPTNWQSNHNIQAKSWKTAEALSSDITKITGS